MTEPGVRISDLPFSGISPLPTELGGSSVHHQKGESIKEGKEIIKACLHIHDFWLRCRYDSPRFVKSSCTVVIRSRTVVNRGES